MNFWRPVSVLAAYGSVLLVGCCCQRSIAQTFSDVTDTAIAGLGGGEAAWTDFDNDGFVDLHVDGAVWKNNGGANFGRVTLEGSELEGSGIWGDYNNDGWADYYSYSGRKLYRNEGESHPASKFTEVSLADAEFPETQNGRGASWADHDNDGDLDLYQGGYETWPSAYYPDTTLRNNGDETFSVTWSQSPDTIVTPGRPRPARGVTSADFDRDGDIDVYVSNYRLEPNGLYVNDGSGQFSDQGAKLGVAGEPEGSFPFGHTVGSAWGDLDNDGELDLFVGNFRHGWGDGSQDHAKFLRNLGPQQEHRFELMNELDGDDWQESYASPVLGDYDNDGDLDLFFTTVYGGDFPRLYRNDGNWIFTNQTHNAGLGELKSTYQAAFADYDNDGDLDLVTSGKLFENTGNGNHWVKLKLVGDGQNISRDAVGAQARISMGDQTLTRQVEAGTGEGNQNDPILHFGLGSHTGPVDLEILWPGGATQRVTGVAVDQLHTIPYAPGEPSAK